MKKEAVLPLLAAAGWGEERLSELEILGPLDPVLPSPIRFTEASVAGLSAVGLAASDLWELRTGRRQRISLETRQATASMAGTRYLKINNIQAKPEARPPGYGVFPSKNGRWNYLHASFSHHHAATIKVLGVPEDRQAVINAVAKWDGLELEEALLAAGGAGGMVRTKEEWAAHPQSAAVAELPLIEFIKIGEAPPEKLPAGNRPLSGIRVLDLTRVVAGPVGTRTLAEHGADVLRVGSKHLPHVDSQDFETGHGKLSTQIDLRQPAEAEILRELVKQGDVFVQGYRPGAIDALGFAPEDLAKLRPGIVTVSFSAFSHLGPWSKRRGFDTVVQTVSGISWRQGQVVPGPTPGPQFYPVAAIDFLAGYVIAYGVMVALRLRATEGGSWMVRTSLAQVGKWLVDLGEVTGVDLKKIPNEFTPEELKRWMMVTESPAGTLHHFGPVLRMSETQPHWTRPAVPLGYHQPVWPTRG